MHGKRDIFYGTQEPAVKMHGKRVCMQKQSTREHAQKT